MINAPIREDVDVFEAKRLAGQDGFLVKTNAGDIENRRTEAATAKFTQGHSFRDMNPGDLADGAVPLALN